MKRPSHQPLTSTGGDSLTLPDTPTGKSTLLKILCGIYPSDGGRLIVNGAITPILELGIGWNTELDAIDNILLIGTVMGLSLKDAKVTMNTEPEQVIAAYVALLSTTSPGPTE